MFDEDSPGQEHGLIRSERLDRLALRRSERGNRRSEEAHAQGLKRLASPNHRLRAKHLITLRFCCQGWCFAFIREGLQRYPIEHTCFSRPLANQGQGVSRTVVLCSDEGSHVIAYACLSAGAIVLAEVPGALRRNRPDPLAVVVLGRLAVDRRHQGHGHGPSAGTPMPPGDSAQRPIDVNMSGRCPSVPGKF